MRTKQIDTFSSFISFWFLSTLFCHFHLLRLNDSENSTQTGTVAFPQYIYFTAKCLQGYFFYLTKTEASSLSFPLGGVIALNGICLPGL